MVRIIVVNGRRRYDLTGEVFGRLTVIGCVGKRGPYYYWSCRCECGNEPEVRTAALMDGTTRSCGCLQKDRLADSLEKHGTARSAEYGVWCGIRQRCNNPNNEAYKNYGARGIKMCPEWDCPGGFERFFAHVGLRPTPRHTLDRIENDRGYEPGNVRWTTRSTQNRNKRTTRWITFRGETLCEEDWARRFKINSGVFRSRLRRGWSFIRAACLPPKVLEWRIKWRGEERTPTEWSRIVGIKPVTLSNRIRLLGWPLDKAMTTPTLNRGRRHRHDRDNG